MQFGKTDDPMFKGHLLLEQYQVISVITDSVRSGFFSNIYLTLLSTFAFEFYVPIPVLV